jgi:glycosyltransferase involved in cell wall biosynthesis
MTASSESAQVDAGELQDRAMPEGSITITCPAPWGGGGLGRHLQELVQAGLRQGSQISCICESERVPGASVPPPSGPGGSWAIAPLAWAGRAVPSLKVLAQSVRFDAGAARRLPPGQHLLAFNGTALAQFRAARERSAGAPLLVSANSHIDQMLDRHELAHRQYPVEPPWASRLGPRNRREYALAEKIYFASSYIRDSFLERGVEEERLVRFPLTAAERFSAAARVPGRPKGAGRSTYNVLYCGALKVHKGVPLLLEAFEGVPGDDVRLRLLGGWSTRQMRRHIERAQARDGRITAGPGDALEALSESDLYVHPAYEEGFGYAPAEALACGVPMIVSQDTGMKELIRSPAQGLVLPTGDAAAWTEAIRAAVRDERP